MESVRKLLSAVVVASVVALAGCGSPEGRTAGDAEPLASVTATASSEEATPPEVSFDTPLTATEAGARVIEEGDGDTISEGQNVFINVAGFNTEDGELLGHDFDRDPQALPVNDEMRTQLPMMYEVLVGAKVGSLIAYIADPGSEPQPSTESSAAPEEKPEASQVLILQVQRAEDIPEPSPTLSEDEVAELEDAGALPTVEFVDGTPDITIPEDTDAPEGLAVQVLEEGDGREVTTEDKVTAHYYGVRWEDGKRFDGSYEGGEPIPFQLTGVIPGWTKGLEGQKVGSTVVLTIPTDLAYGEEAESMGRPAGPLVFVVEIVDAEGPSDAE
ncbi:FKBP-type peptidyl-prolyl cis-trans isomerase [Zhihengliuella somnathii]